LSIIMAPVALLVALIPGQEKFVASWVRGYLTLLFWPPLAAIYSILAVIIMVVSIDTSTFVYVGVSIAYIIGASKIPNISEGLSTAAVATVAITVATMPSKALMGSVRSAINRVDRGISNLAG